VPWIRGSSNNSPWKRRSVAGTGDWSKNVAVAVQFTVLPLMTAW
jgi:hypothetical protein